MLKATENPTKALATSDGCARSNSSSAYDFMARCAVERIVIRFKLDSREHDVVWEQHEHGGLVHKDEILRHRDVRQRRQTRRYSLNRSTFKIFTIKCHVSSDAQVGLTLILVSSAWIDWPGTWIRWWM